MSRNGQSIEGRGVWQIRKCASVRGCGRVMVEIRGNGSMNKKDWGGELSMLIVAVNVASHLKAAG